MYQCGYFDECALLFERIYFTEMICAYEGLLANLELYIRWPGP